MELAKRFIGSYLNTHGQYLKSICDVIRVVQGGSKEILNNIKVDHIYFDKIRSNYTGDEERAFRNLRNSWYHECALHYPFDVNGNDATKIRMKFAPWKIIQFYYSVYTAASAIVRCYSSAEKLSHEKTLSILTNNFVKNPKLGTDFFVQPFGLYVSNNGEFKPLCKDAIPWEYGKKYHCPNIEKCLLSAHKKRKNKNVTLLHYFKDLREWINYEDPYLFIRLYGPTVIDNLNDSLLTISNAFNTLSDTFLINFYGLDRVYSEFDEFIENIKTHLKIDPEFLQARFNLYRNSF